MKKICLAATLIAFPLSIMADEVRQHGAHVHGAANLMVSTEGHDLLVALDSPAYNLFGFEHAPSTDVQRTIVAQGMAALRDGEQVLMPTAAAACSLRSVHIESETFDTDDHGHGHGHGGHSHSHDDHDHDNDHDHEH
ncbi:MAG: DUF2796 domain-containing protein [Saccharospirillum sp.]|nr:DUF2796 domain-containing protein [Saccharospirillum sp.]